MNISYFEDEAPRLELFREEIEVCSDPAQLIAWREGLEEAKASIKAQLEAKRAAGIEDEDWVFSCSRVLMFANMGLNRVKKRLVKLGVEPDERARQIAKLEEQLQVRRAQAVFGEAFQEAAKALLSEADFIDLWNAALGRMPAPKVAA